MSALFLQQSKTHPPHSVWHWDEQKMFCRTRGVIHGATNVEDCLIYALNYIKKSKAEWQQEQVPSSDSTEISSARCLCVRSTYQHQLYQAYGYQCWDAAARDVCVASFTISYKRTLPCRILPWQDGVTVSRAVPALPATRALQGTAVLGISI